MSTTSTRQKGLRTWVDVDRRALKHNIDQFRSMVSKDVKIAGVIKSNAYGHGLMETAGVLSEEIDWFAVDSLVEGLALRGAGIKKPILVLGYTLPERFQEASENDIALTISQDSSLKYLVEETNTFENPLKIHIKVDTGMHRQGFGTDELESVLELVSGFEKKNVVVEGLYTHFAAAKNPAFPNQTMGQIEEFDVWREAFDREGLSVMCHASATSGTCLYPQANYDMVRIGIGLYGLWPSREVQAATELKYPLKPVLSWKAVISEVKELSAGMGIGYDLTETLKQDSKIAIIPIGYWHGYPRLLSSIGHALVCGTRARVLGRVSMDMIVLDVTDIENVEAGEVVTLLGSEAGEEVSANELAELSQTINYEMVTRINSRIRRFVV